MEIQKGISNSKISKQSLKVFEQFFLKRSMFDSNTTIHLFEDFSPPNVVELDKELNKQVKQDHLASLLIEVVYVWFIKAMKNQIIKYQKIYYDQFNSSSIIIYIKFSIIKIQQCDDKNLKSKNALIQFFETIFKELKQKSNNNQFCQIPCKFDEQYNKIIPDMKDDFDFEKFVLKVLSTFENKTQLFLKKNFITEILNASLYNKMYLQKKQLKNTNNWLILQQLLKSIFYSNKIIKQNDLKRYFNFASCCSKNKEFKSFLSRQEIYDKKRFGKQRSQMVLNQQIQILKKILDSLSDQNVIIYQIEKIFQFQIFCCSIQLTSLKDCYFIVTITKDKEIMVRLQTDVKVFLEERDIKMHWINLLKFESISFGARIGLSPYKQRKPPQGRENFVILFASDIYNESAIFFKIALLIDSLIIANYLLKPGLSLYRLSEQLADQESNLRKKMQFMFELFVIKYQNEESIIQEQSQKIQ